MSYRNRHGYINSIFAVLILAGCTTGLDSGSIERSFSGIKSATVTGPESIRVNWDANSACSGYGIYRLGNSSDSAKIADATVPPYALKSAPLIESERTYNLAVGCTRSGKVQGLNISRSVTTWPAFAGGITATLDTAGQTPVVVLNWSYVASSEVTFDIYAASSPLPTSKDTWALTRSGGVGTSYTNTKHCSVMGNRVRLGEGSCAALAGGQGYMFKIVAHYPDGTYSTDFTGNAAYIDVPPPFAAPDCLLTTAGIGADAATSSLFLRCSAANMTTACPTGTITTRAYQGVNGVRISVSDLLTGAGTLRIQPQAQSVQANDRAVEGLELEYNCTSGSTTKKSIVRYDGNPVTRTDGSTFTPVKPVLKFNSTDFVRAPAESTSAGEVPSYFGKSVAVGDFNCDGKPDLAVGLPDVTYNLAPYFSKNPNSGAVKIYYNYALTATGEVAEGETQMLSFSDLPAYANFGFALASGNINGDYIERTDGGPGVVNNKFACDDLIIGAPGSGTSSMPGDQGGAYIFYGHPQKFPQPLNLATLTVNDSTCYGSINATVCDPVRLTSDLSTSFRVPFSGMVGSMFGYSVAYIRDFNADGYGDVAIGNPGCGWDGGSKNSNSTTGTDPAVGLTTGCVLVYWGGPNGLQPVDVGVEPGSGGALRMTSTFIKVYPPIPQSGMQFGASLGSGGDVDGKLPVPLVNNAGNVVLASGSDFAVGAPGFLYSDLTTEAGGFTTALAWNPYTGVNGTRDPLVTVNEGDAYAPTGSEVVAQKSTPPTNGAWAPISSWTGPTMPIPTQANLKASSGIVFLYLGRSSLAQYELQTTSNHFRVPSGSVGAAPGQEPSITSLASASVQSRQNGSKGFVLASPVTGYNPRDAFYNCGTRGLPGSWPLTGPKLHKHISCLAGRNNVSWIFPQLKPTDAPVAGFGRKITIAGAKEQNILALLELNDSTRITDRPSLYQRQSNGTKFVGLAQGDIHERIRGDSLWEMGVAGNTTSGTEATCDVHSDASWVDAKYSGAACNRKPTRSAVRESYSNIAGATLTDGNIQSDINRDGYADVVVASDSGEVYTFFGNYAADFAYPTTLMRSYGLTNPYTTSANCSVTQMSSLAAALADGIDPTNLNPFRTFAWTHSAGAGSTYTFTSIHPLRPTGIGVGNEAQLKFLGDVDTANNFNYSAVSYSSTIRSAMTACLPQRRTYLTPVTSMTSADLNGDRIVDIVAGFSTETGTTGMARGLLSTSTGGSGLGSEFVYNSGSTNYARAGYDVAATNWRYTISNVDSAEYETSRRDLFVGAPLQSRGTGAVLAYSGVEGSQVSTSNPKVISSSVSVPRLLGTETSKIVGDVNGDGYDDIFVPVKRLDAAGSVFFDGLVYFGSAFGPVTTPMCLEKISLIKKSNGSSISTSDCSASITGMTAVIGTTPIRLPQYFTKPSGMSSTWALYVRGAGDINGDARSDVIVNDLGQNPPVIYSIFGSDIGLISASPSMGPSLNKNPQIVTANTSMYPRGDFTHGDFNGDGFEDIAFANTYLFTFQMAGGWLCNPVGGSGGTLAFCGNTAAGYDNPINGRWISAAGAVYVVYGGPQGLQTPVNSSGNAVDFDFSRSLSCDSFYHDCKKTANVLLDFGGANGTGVDSSSYADLDTTASSNLFKYSRLVYGTIYHNGVTDDYTLGPVNSSASAINTNATDDADANRRRPACIPGSGSNSPSVCVSTVIPPPNFFNLENSWNWNMGSSYFGSALTAGDLNGDGIDDLIVGNASFSHTYDNLGNATSLNGHVVSGAPTTVEPAGHGAALIYYGAKGYGVVAPNAEDYLGGGGRGTDANGTIIANKLVLQIYPEYDTTPANTPSLDTAELRRGFGKTVTTGDYNGDGFDDLAVSSERGQIYVYYGPICQWDNAHSTLFNAATSMYQNPNKTLAAPTGITCQTYRFNSISPSVVSSPENLTAITLNGRTATKSLAPQMIEIPGLGGSEDMGRTLISLRKGHGSLKSPGSSTEIVPSDLIVAASAADDPNASPAGYKKTGLGYVYFGHKAGDPLFNSKAGLYIGSASYNSSITQVVESGVTYNYYTPIILRPHTPSSSVAKFFAGGTSVGDLNGDGRLDLLMSTVDIDTTQTPGQNASYGGGFRLFY